MIQIQLRTNEFIQVSLGSLIRTTIKDDNGTNYIEAITIDGVVLELVYDNFVDFNNIYK